MKNGTLLLNTVSSTRAAITADFKKYGRAQISLCACGQPCAGIEYNVPGLLMQRSRQLGIDLKKLYIGTEIDGRRCELSFYEEDAFGNIKIFYYEPDGEPLCYTAGQWSRLTHFYRRRLAPANIKPGKGKYDQPRKAKADEYPSQPIYYPASVIEAYRKSTEIPLLAITEGEFKAEKACACGQPCASFAGVSTLGSRNGVPESLVRVIKQCRVKKLLILFDSDAVAKNRLIEVFNKSEDLSTRLFQFFYAVNTFRKAFLDLMLDCDLYFGQINGAHYPKIKGLDDLLCFRAGAVADIPQLDKNKGEFTIYKISENGEGKLRRHFLLERDKKRMPADLYDLICDAVGGQEFYFDKAKYQWKETRLFATYHPDAESYVRIGTEYFKKTYKIRKDDGGKIIKNAEISCWKKQTIMDDYRHVQDFTHAIKRYEGFCNIPDNNINTYSQVIEGCWNLYQEPAMRPAKGKWGTIKAMLQHVFAEQYSMGLDWITLLWTKPTHKLPAICLVSNEKGTGKSTLMFFLCAMLGDNAALIGNEEFNSEFNSHWVSKVLTCIDESFIEKKMVKERIKQQITSKRIGMRAMHQNKQEIDCHLHFIMTSNDEENFMQIDDDERRFWVRKVPALPEGQDPDFFAKLISEIPAFLYELENREVAYKRRTDLWFHREDFETAALRNVSEATRPLSEKLILDYVQRHAINCDVPALVIEPEMLYDEYREKHRLWDASTNISISMRKLGFDKSKTPKKFVFLSIRERIKESLNSDAITYETFIVERHGAGRPYIIEGESWEKLKKLAGVEYAC